MNLHLQVGDKINFLHYGSALRQVQVLQEIPPSDLDKRALVKTLEARNCNSDFRLVVNKYGPTRSRKINVLDLQRELSKARILQGFFEKLACRGFSHRVERGIRFNEPLRDAIDLRIALMPDDSLFYPPGVKRFLRRSENNHYFSAGFPSIAFALGETRSDGWYIYVLQSDIAGTRSSSVRQHFRGWRKVLFAHVLREAVETTSNVFLCAATDVMKACRPDFPCSDRVPLSWTGIYDDTARFFNMESVRVAGAVNIQIYPDLPATRTDQFYRFAVTEQTRQRVRSLLGGIP